MTLSLFLVPAERTTGLVRARGPVDDGIVLVVGRPSARPVALHREVLAGLGARDDVRGAARRHGPDRDILLTRAWVAAHRARALVVAHADLCGSPTWFGPVAEAVSGAGASLALVCDDTGGDKVADWVESVGGSVAGPDELDAFLKSAIRPRLEVDDTLAPSESADAFPALLPQAAFYSFRARCRDTLGAAEFASVDRVYRDTFKLFGDFADPTAERIRDALAGRIADCTVQGEVLPVVRGAQAALFTRGLLLAVNVGPAKDAVRDRVHQVLTDDEIRALRAYREPRVGVATVVRSMDLEYVNMRNMRLRNVDEDGRYTSKGLKREAPQSSRVLFRAQRHVRLLEGAGPDDRFLTQDSLLVADAIRWTKADLNLPGLATRKEQPRKAWTDAMNVRVRPLTLHARARQ